MKLKQRIAKRYLRRSVLSVSVLAALSSIGTANAFSIDSGNDQIKMRWDNTFRYNAGWRAQDPSYDLIAPTSGTAASERKFHKKGDMVTNRLDVLSEFDFVYQQTTGFRVSGAGWYDKRMDNDRLPAAVPGFGPFVGDKYPDQVKRYYNGPSGEWLDAFVFTKFNLADVPVSVRLGQHMIYWGETLFSLGDGISSGQGYADLRKAAAIPGSEAKEIFKPLNQISFTAQVSPEFTVMGQYFLDYKTDLFPLGGSYFSPVDFLTYAGGTVANPGQVNWDGVEYNGVKKRGDWGLGAKWQAEWINGTLGFYYREYTPKNGGALAINAANSIFSLTSANPGVAYTINDGDAPRTKLFGLSLSRLFGHTSFGMDMTYRKDATLSTKPFTIINGPTNAFGIPGVPTFTNGLKGWAPIGDVYTATFNVLHYFGNSPVYDSAVLTAEFDYDALIKVTKNAQNFGGRANCVVGTGLANSAAAGAVAPNQGYYGCATGNSYGINMLFTPKWFQVLDGVDLQMPMFYSLGLHGNSPVPALGQNEGMGVYYIGLQATIKEQYDLTLQYNGQLYKRRQNIVSGAPFSNAALGDFSDRNWVSLTFKAGF